MIKPLINEENILASVFVADTFLKRLMGYMFRKQPHYEVLMIKPCNSIHTFFMRFSIDVLFINKHMEVIKKVENLKPGKIIMPIKEAFAVIEGRAGLFEIVRIGDKINI